MSSQPRTAAVTVFDYLLYVLSLLKLFSARTWLIAFLGAAVAAFAISVPAALIENPVFGRTVEIRAQDYVLLTATAVLAGLIIASYAVDATTGSEGKATGGGFLCFIAVGCPVCNKLVVGAIGTSGALNVFAPAQLFLGLAALALLMWALALRARAVYLRSGITV